MVGERIGDQKTASHSKSHSDDLVLDHTHCSSCVTDVRHFACGRLEVNYLPYLYNYPVKFSHLRYPPSFALRLLLALRNIIVVLVIAFGMACALFGMYAGGG